MVYTIRKYTVLSNSTLINEEITMVKQELIDRSPVRYFEQAMNGGVKAGEIGILASKKGLGKTSVLVQIGLDMLLQNKEVVHVSFNQQTSHVMAWYEDIFTETAKKKNLADVDDVKNELIRKRVLLNFNQDIIKTAQITKTLSTLAESGIKVEGLIVDGLDFSKVSSEEITAMKDYAKKAEVAVWYSCDAESADAASILDAKVLETVDALIYLESKSDSIELKILKGHGQEVPESHLKLDTKTLLMADK